jgi:hypothetical protein
MSDKRSNKICILRELIKTLRPEKDNFDLCFAGPECKRQKQKSDQSQFNNKFFFRVMKFHEALNVNLLARTLKHCQETCARCDYDVMEFYSRQKYFREEKKGEGREEKRRKHCPG